MSVGPGPNLRGTLTTASACSHCSSSNGAQAAQWYQMYAGPIIAIGDPPASCPGDGDCCAQPPPTGLQRSLPTPQGVSLPQ